MKKILKRLLEHEIVSPEFSIDLVSIFATAIERPTGIIVEYYHGSTLLIKCADNESFFISVSPIDGQSVLANSKVINNLSQFVIKHEH